MNCSTESTLSKFYFRAVEGAARDIVSHAMSSITGRFEIIQEELNVTLFCLHHEVNKIKSSIDAARARQITNQMLLKWLSQIIDAAYNKIKEIVKPGKVQPIILDGFSEEEYMLFFREHAFGSAGPEDHPDQLAKMGGEIAKKMNGSIWGAKIIGELLRDNLNAQFWSIFLEDGFINSQLINICT